MWSLKEIPSVDLVHQSMIRRPQGQNHSADNRKCNIKIIPNRPYSEIQSLYECVSICFLMKNFLQVQHIKDKGRAVFATRCFQKGEYVVEYHGDLLQITDAKKREAEYAQNPATGCYMYYFQYLCKTYWYGTTIHFHFLFIAIKFKRIATVMLNDTAAEQFLERYLVFYLKPNYFDLGSI